MVELEEKTCLIIVHDVYTSKKLSDIFQSINFNVIIANSGEEAINKAKILPFNLAFIGSNLPDMSCLGLIKNLKKNYPDRDYIVLSENPSVQNEINALRAGANDYFIKPYDIEDIIKKAKELVQNQYLQCKLKESEEKFRRITEETFIGIIIIQNNRIVYCNQSFSDIAGFSIEEMLNWQINDLVQPIHQDYRETILNYIIAYQKDAEKPVTEVEFPYYTKKAEIKWARVNLKTIQYLERNALLVTMIDISERKKTEISLRESEKKFRRLFESNPDLFFLIDKDYTFLEFSGKEEDLYVKPEVFLGKKISEVFSPELSKLYTDAIKKTIALERPQIIEYKLPMKHGLRHFEAQILYFTEEKVALFARDITDRKKAELALRESEEKFRKIFESNPDLFFFIDKDYTFLEFSGRKEDLYVMPENFLGKKIYELFPPELSKIFTDAIENTFNTKAPQIIEYQLSLKNSVHYYEARLLFFSEQKIAAFIRDITDRKQAEIALRESEEKFREITEQTFIGVAIFQDDKIVYSNKAHSKMTGYSLEEILDLDRDHLIQPIHEDYSERVLKFINQYQEDINQPVSEIEFPFYNKKKELKWILLKRKTIIYQQRPGILVTTIDITEKKQAELALKESEGKFRRITEENFVGIVIVQNNKIVYGNQMVSEITGVSIDEIVGWDIIEAVKLVSEEHRKLVLDHLNEYQFEPEKPVSELEFLTYTRNGEPKWVHGNFKTIIFQEKNALFATFIDITEKKLSEIALRESEEKFYKAFNSNALSMSISSIREDRFEEVNDVFLNDLGYTREEVIGKTSKELNLWIDESQRDELFRLLREKDNIFNFHIRATTKFGGVRHGLLSVSKITLKNKPYLLNIVNDITKIKLAEIELKESEEKFRTIAEQSLMGITIIQDGVFKYFNDRITEITGYSAEEIKSWNPNEFVKTIHPEDREFMMEQARKKQEGDPNVIQHYRYKAIKKDGMIQWREIFAKTINYGGRLADLVMTYDITDQIKAEQALKESEEKFRNIAEQSLMGIAIAQDNKVKYINQAYADIFGYTVEEMMNWELKDAVNSIHPDDREFILEQLFKKQSGENNVPKHYEYRGINSSGEVIWVENFSKTVVYNGRSADLITLIDITKKKETERKLKESEENFREITEQTLIGYVILQDNKIVYSNKAHSDITGYSLEEMLSWDGQDLLQPVHENYRNMVLNYITKFQNSLEQLTAEVEFQYYTKKKELKWVRTHLNTIFYRQRRAILVSVIDITESKKVEEMIKHEVQKLKELDDLRNEFIDRASHELKTPLNSIYSASALFLNLYQNELNHKQFKLIKIIDKGAKRLEKLIKNMLDSSRLDIRKLELDIKSVNLIDLLKESIDELYYMMLERNITFKSEFPKETYVECDKLRIQQVFDNILSNAIKNTPPNGQLSIILKNEINNVKIIISDTGVGFTEQEKTKLFQKFGKIERYGKGMDINTEGSGLGLFISKEIVDLHKGDIQLDSKGRNKGTKCIVTLPIKYHPE